LITAKFEFTAKDGDAGNGLTGIAESISMDGVNDGETVTNLRMSMAPALS
jgi:hypothetical protein